MEGNKFSKFSLYVLVIGVIAALYVLITTLLHSSFGSVIRGQTIPVNQMIAPKSKF